MGSEEIRKDSRGKRRCRIWPSFFDERDRIDLPTLSNAPGNRARLFISHQNPNNLLFHDDLYAVAGSRVMRLGEGSDGWNDDLRFALSRQYPHIEPPSKDRIAGKPGPGIAFAEGKQLVEREARLRTREEREVAEKARAGTAKAHANLARRP